MLVFCNTSKRKLSFTFERPRVLAALPAIPLRDIPATGVRRPCSFPRFARQRHGTHVLLQGRQIAFERPCRHPRTSRRELSGEVRNCHLNASNRSSDSLNDLLNSSSESIASSSDFIEHSALLKASRVVELVNRCVSGFGIVTLYQASLGTCKGAALDPLGRSPRDPPALLIRGVAHEVRAIGASAE